MTIKQAKERLTTYRRKQNKLRKHIDALRGFLRENGVDPDAPTVDLTKRNEEIYRRYLDGLNYVEIGKEFNLSATRITSICKRIEFLKEKRTVE